jgi:hypothetical protein
MASNSGPFGPLVLPTNTACPERPNRRGALPPDPQRVRRKLARDL